MRPVDVAAAVADGFLAGAWEAPALAERGAVILGQPLPWLAPLARAATRRFPAPPQARELASWLARSKPLRRACAVGLLVRQRLWPEPVMAPAPRLAGCALPPLLTEGDLAAWLGLSIGELSWFADVRGLERISADGPLRHYRYRWLHKAVGYRLVEAPRPRLRAVQRRILHEILDRLPPHQAAHGFRRGRSVRSYVEPHVARQVVVHLDLREFFPSVRAAAVRGIFRAAGYPRPVTGLLAGLCLNRVPPLVWDGAPALAGDAAIATRARARRFYAHPHLPTGAPTSPALGNLVAFALDVRLSAAAMAAGARYTRYADDLTFSGDADFARGAARFVRLAARIAGDQGFRLHEGKTRIMRASTRQRIAGVVINARPNLARHEYDRLKATVHNVRRLGASSQNRGGVSDFRAHLLGRIAWLESLHPERGRRLRAALDGLDWSR
ncbi:MAG: reverse transcriptase family protein [Polyangiaceae bacterium]